METLEAIARRRSIRKFRSRGIDRDQVERILLAATQAPSGKNRQPWRFYVVTEQERGTMVDILRRGIEESRESDPDPGSSEWTASVMEQAPVTVFVFNPYGVDPWLEHTTEQSFRELVDVQSVGAAIQNMLLAAVEIGLGSLWICDVFYAYTQLKEWLGAEGQMVAAVSLGHSGEEPGPRPRKGLEEVVEWI